MNNGNTKRVLVAGLLVLFAAASVQAQGREGGRRGGGRRGGFGMGRGGIDKVTLLGLEQVQKELKVTDEQKEKLTAVTDDVSAKTRELFQQAFQGGGGGDRQAAFAKMQEERAKITAAAEKKLAGILKEDQTKRIGEIVLQQQGIRALNDPKIGKQLKLDEEQTKTIKELFADNQERLQKLFQEARESGDFNAIREASGELQAELELFVTAVLSDEQAAAFNKMKGKKFELDRSALRRGFGGFGGGRRGGRGEGGGRRRRPDGDGGERRRPRPDNDE